MLIRKQSKQLLNETSITQLPNAATVKAHLENTGGNVCSPAPPYKKAAGLLTACTSRQPHVNERPIPRSGEAVLNVRLWVLTAPEFAVASKRNDGLATLFDGGLAQAFGVVGAVCHHLLAW